MPGLDHRRVFLCLLLFAALETASSTAHAADGDSLWDVLSRTQNTNLDPAKNATQNLDANQSPRRSLGPVPGFTLPLNQDADIEQVLARPKRKKSGMFGGLGDWWSRMEQKTGTKITASGHQTLSLRYDSVSGNQSAYNDSQYYGQGSNGIYSDSQLDIDATLFNALHYHTQISNSPYRNPNDNKVKLDYNTKKVRVEAGDFNPTLAGNSLVDFNRSLHGIQVTNNWNSNLKTTLLYSQTRAEARTIVINGNGSTGPYYVYAGQIVDGSVHVRVDNKDMVQGANNDYTLDLYTGQLNFTHGNVILPTSTIAVSYEAVDYSNSKGTIYGARTDVAISHSTAVGFTYLTQTSPTNTVASQRDESNQAPVVPQATAFSTQAQIDVTKLVQVTYQGVQLTRWQPELVGGLPNLAAMKPGYYFIDTYSTPSVAPSRIYIYLGNPGNGTDYIHILYTPLSNNPTPGNRSIVGLDGRFSLGKFGNVALESAFSGLALSGKNYEGQALQMIASVNPFKNLHTRLTVRDVSPSFSSIQSPGFNLNEKSITLDADYQASKQLSFTVNWQKAKRPSYSSTTSSNVQTVIGNDDYSQYTLGANYRLSSAATLSLTRSSMGTNYIIGGNSTNSNDSLSLNYTKGQLSFQTALARNVSNVTTSYAALGLGGSTTDANALVTTNSSTLTERLSTQWQPIKWLTLGGSYSNNAIRNFTTGTGNTNTDARDTAFDADFRLIKNLHLHYNYELSDTGNSGTTTKSTTTSGAATASSLATRATANVATTNSGMIVDPARFALLSSSQGTRDVTGTTTGTTVNTGLLGGGGVNDGLGSGGNYSGGIGSTTVYGGTTYGGRSANNRVSLDYTPRPGMQIGFHINNSSSLGDYQYNSNTNGVGGSFNWDLSKRIHINAVYEVQKLSYTNSVGGSNTTTGVLSLNGRPFGGKLEIDLSWQSSTTSSSFAAASATASSGTSTDLSAMRLGLSYRISARQSLFTEITSSVSTGTYADKETALSFGLENDLTQQLAFRLGWQFHNRIYKDVTSASSSGSSNLNYSANSLLAEFNLHF